jgi:O-antigen/teichoic acid export membrane protein
MDTPETADFRESMQSIPATLLVGAGALVTLGLSAITLKVFAVLLGPTGLGALALLQSAMNLGAITATLGLNVTVVRLIGHARNIPESSVASVTRAALTLGAALSVGLILGGVLIGDVLARTWFRSQISATDVVLIAVAASLTVVSWVQLAVQNAHHEIRAVVAVNVGTALASAAVGIALVSAMGIRGLAPALCVTAAVQLALAIAFGRQYFPRQFRFRQPEFAAVRSLIGSGVPVLASQIGSIGAAFVLPLMILAREGAEGVGLYRSAAAISVGYLTFFISALTQDYLPRVAAARDPAYLAILVERRMRIVVGLAAPIIVALLAVGPWLLGALYTDAFRPAISVLQWQLIGDLFRLPASVLGFVLLARRTAFQYAGVELLGGTLLVLGTWLGLQLGGLAAVGPAYLAAQMITYGVVWLAVRRFLPTAPGRLQLVTVAVAGSCAVILLVDPPEIIRVGLLAMAAIALGLLAFPRLRELHFSGEA